MRYLYELWCNGELKYRNTTGSENILAQKWHESLMDWEGELRFLIYDSYMREWSEYKRTK